MSGPSDAGAVLEIYPNTLRSFRNGLGIRHGLRNLINSTEPTLRQGSLRKTTGAIPVACPPKTKGQVAFTAWTSGGIWLELPGE